MENIAALIIATSVLVLIPGPNVALIVANTLQYGLRGGIFTVAGTTVGIAMQLALVAGGLAALIQIAASALTWIKWFGVAYLLYLALKTWRRPANKLAGVATEPKQFFRRGLALAVINPKVLLFNAAFLPQFLQGTSNATSQLMLVTSVYLGVIALGDVVLWAVFASSARRALQRFSHLRNRLTAIFLFAAGIGMALTRRGT